MAKIKEIWKDVVGYKAKYEISSLGRIRSLDKWVFNGKNGNKSFRFMSGSLMKPTFDSNKYLQVNLLGKMWKVHRLVALAFIPNPKGKATINHKNGIKTDNRVENLEWATQQENVTHSWANGLAPNFGSNNHTSKLKDKDVLFIRSNYKAGVTGRVYFAKKYGVNVSTIDHIVDGKSWKHLCQAEV